MAYDNEYNVIDISGKDSSSKLKKYFCNHCRRSLFLRDKDTQEYLCYHILSQQSVSEESE
jgi:competence CoiA-like predicted nuclease